MNEWLKYSQPQRREVPHPKRCLPEPIRSKAGFAMTTVLKTDKKSKIEIMVPVAFVCIVDEVGGQEQLLFIAIVSRF
jgi:hypothetical protein